MNVRGAHAFRTFHILGDSAGSYSDRTSPITHHFIPTMVQDPSPNPKQILASDIVLEDDAVRLRTLTEADFHHLLPFVQTDAGLWKYSPSRIVDERDLLRYLEQAIVSRSKGDHHPFIVYDKLQQAYAGCTRFYGIQPDYLSLQIGYTWYGSAFQGTKVNKHCKYLLFRYAFETLGMERVELCADKDNARSIAAMKSVGCTVEGILRSHMPKPNGGRRDSIVLSILKDEWSGRVKTELEAKL